MEKGSIQDSGSGEAASPETLLAALRERQAEAGRLGEIQQSLLDALPARVALLDEAGRIVASNVAWQRFGADSGLPAEAYALGADYLAACEQLLPDEPEASLGLREVLAGGKESVNCIYSCHTPDRQRWCRVHFAALSAAGRHGAVVMHFDVTDSVQAEQRLFQLAHFDHLTALPNRLLFLDRLRHTLDMAKRYAWKMAVMFIDLDRFKIINDTLGHHAGDLLLQQFGRRLSGCVRQSDTVARLGGDEFAVLLPELSSGEEAGLVARKLLSVVAQPFQILGQDIFGGASVGIAVYPDDAPDADTLLRYADTAMYRAKEAGRNNYQFHTAAMNERALARLRLDTDLRYALARQEFEVYYQPKVSCATGEIVGSEALLRWNHPTRGLVLPTEFVPMLEELGLINAVGEWVLNEACVQSQRWIDAGFGRPSVAVNLSARQFEGEGLVPMVRAALAASGLAPERLELELTESVLMRNAEQVVATLAELRRLGVRLSVDDFGTGYSSLSYLKRFPLDAVKVDRSFVQDITADPDDASITRAVITMAHNLKLKVIAEGVETQGQLALLIANQCDEIQGFYFSRPVPAMEMGKMLEEHRGLSSEQLRSEQRQRTLLLVDDEENILASMRRLLRRDGYRILTANGGEQGLELLANNEVDVILSDQRMPGMTGVEFLRRVKTIYPDTVRMVLSGYTELQSITDAINEGAIYKFLTKPWEDEQIRANIEEAFRHKELADDNRRLNHEVQIANKELAHANQQLRQLLEEKQRQLLRDEATLNIAQEVLQRVPVSIVGFDDEGLVVFANEAADALIGEGVPLLGSFAEERLPPLLSEVLRAGEGARRAWVRGESVLHVLCREMGERSRSRGRLLICVPEGANDAP